MNFNIIAISIFLLSFSVPLVAQDDDDVPVLEDRTVDKPIESGRYRDAKRIGFKDASGKVAIPAEYEFVFPKKWANYMLVAKNGRYGAIDAYNQVRIPLAYQHIKRVQNWSVSRHVPGRVVTEKISLIAKKNALYGLLDASGNALLPFVYSAIDLSGSSYLNLCKDGKWGMASQQGKKVVACSYDTPLRADYISKQIIASRDGRFGIMDFDEKALLPFAFDNIKCVGRSSSNYEVTKAGKKGVYNKKTLEERIPLVYESLKATKKGYWVVKQNGRFGLLDQTGKIVVPIAFEGLSMPFYGLPYCSLVQLGENAFTVYNANGQRILQDSFAEIRSYLKSAFIVKTSKGKYGMFRSDGTALVPPEYDEIKNSLSRSLFIRKGEYYAAFDTTGKQATPFNIVGFRKGDIHAANLADGKVLLVGLNKDGLADYTVFDEIIAFDPARTNYMVLQTRKGKTRMGFVHQFRWVAPVIYENIQHIPNRLSQQLKEQGVQMYRYPVMGVLPGGKRQLICTDGTTLDVP